MPRTISEKALLTMKASQYMNASQRQFFPQTSCCPGSRLRTAHRQCQK